MPGPLKACSQRPSRVNGAVATRVGAVAGGLDEVVPRQLGVVAAGIAVRELGAVGFESVGVVVGRVDVHPEHVEERLAVAVRPLSSRTSRD